MNQYGIPCLDLSQSSDSLQLFQPLSLWKLVEQHVPEPERWEVKNMLGANLVDESLQLHDEISLLRNILKEHENQDEVPIPRIPEPPQVRERLIKEIAFFVDSVKEKLNSQGMSTSNVLSKHNRNVLDYVHHHKTKKEFLGSHRALSSLSLSSDGQHNSLSSPSTGRSSQISCLSDEIQDMSHNFNVLQIDDVIQHLRSTLQTEISQLLNDVEFLQSNLFERIELSSPRSCYNPSKSIPTISDLERQRSCRVETPVPVRSPKLSNVERELRQERSILEKELLRETENEQFFNLPNPSLRRFLSSVEHFQDRKVESERRSQSATVFQRRETIPSIAQNMESLQPTPPPTSIKNVNNSSSINPSATEGPFVPRPPTVGQPKHRSVEKFRRMVYHCRDSN